MCLLFETIHIMDGVPQHPAWHEARMSRASLELWGNEQVVNLDRILDIPTAWLSGSVRCNIRYDTEIREITFRHCEKRMIRSLKLVRCDAIDYHLKFSDRSELESLMGLRGACDDILIVKNGFLTDTSVSNIIFSDGDRWVTPANPLLKGTCRDRLVARGKLYEQDLRPEDLVRFAGFKLINALRDPEEQMVIPVSQIIS